MPCTFESSVYAIVAAKSPNSCEASSEFGCAASLLQSDMALRRKFRYAQFFPAYLVCAASYTCYGTATAQRLSLVVITGAAVLIDCVD